MNFDEFGIRKKTSTKNELILFREKNPCETNLQSSANKISVRNECENFLCCVYTRTWCQSAHRKISNKNFRDVLTLQQLQLKISFQLLRYQLRQMNKYSFKNDIGKVCNQNQIKTVNVDTEKPKFLNLNPSRVSFFHFWAG